VENWNLVNNSLSDAVLQADILGDLLEELGCRLWGTRNGPVFRGTCPVHGGRGYNFNVQTDGETIPIRWRCFSHGCHQAPRLKGNLLGLVRGALTKDPDHPATMSEARAFVERFVGRSPTTPRPRPKTAISQSPSIPEGLTREMVRSRLIIPSPYFLNRGFGAEVLDRYDVGDSSKLNRAIMPLYDDEGGDLCVGWAERSFHPACRACRRAHPADAGCTAGEPRWRFPRGFTKGRWLYGYAEAARSPLPFVLLVEGIPDVLRAAEAGLPAVACLGTELPFFYLAKLERLRKKVVVAFDNDDSGQRQSRAAVLRLTECGVLAESRHPPTGVKDVADLAPKDVTAWWGDCGSVPMWWAKRLSVLAGEPSSPPPARRRPARPMAAL
jgi:hypothetical protein